VQNAERSTVMSLSWMMAYAAVRVVFAGKMLSGKVALFCPGGVFAGVVSDYLGGRALTCMMMLLLAAPSVSHCMLM